MDQRGGIKKTRTKLTLVCGQDFQIHFSVWKVFSSDSSFAEFFPMGNIENWVIMMPTLSSLVVPQVVVTVTCSATSDTQSWHQDDNSWFSGNVCLLLSLPEISVLTGLSAKPGYQWKQANPLLPWGRPWFPWGREQLSYSHQERLLDSITTQRLLSWWGWFLQYWARFWY